MLFITLLEPHKCNAANYSASASTECGAITRRRVHGALVSIAVIVLVAYAALPKLQYRHRNASAGQIRAVTERLPHFHDSVDCDAVFANDSLEIDRARQWPFDSDAFWAPNVSTDPGYTCRSIRETFGFLDRPLSEEERLFPHAYGLLVHAEATQVYFLLSAIYQPQNAYCSSREAANAMVHSEKVREHLEFIKRLDVPDEKLWGSILGNLKELMIPGSFDAQALYTRVIGAGANAMPGTALEMMSPSLQEPCALPYYFIGWYQTWAHTGPCHGRYASGSCVFGVGDLPVLYRRGELMAHKLYLNTELAAFFCLYERVRLRAFDPRQQRFRGTAYAHLPPVQLHNGVPLNDVHNVSC